MEEGNFEIDTKKLVRYTAYFCCSGFFGAVFTNGVMGRPYFFRPQYHVMATLVGIPVGLWYTKTNMSYWASKEKAEADYLEEYLAYQEKVRLRKEASANVTD